MHELSFAQEMLKLALAALPDKKKRISELFVVSGVFNRLEEICLKTAFEAISVGTPAEGAKITLQVEPALATCTKCNFSQKIVDPDPEAFICPMCGAFARISGGNKLYLESMEVEE